MNDLHYIFYEPKRMFVDTSDMSCEGERAHRRLCDYTWFNDGPPLNQNKSLRQISHIEESDWSSVKRELLAKGWLEIGAYLLHRGVIKSLNESKVKYVENFNRSAKMNRQIPLAVSDPDAVTGCVTIYVTSTVTPTVTLPQSESESKSESDRKGTTRQSSQLNGDGLTKLTLEKSACERVAGEIIGNKHGWAYDNCRVKPSHFPIRKSLVTVLLPFSGRVCEAEVHAAWQEAVTRTHAASSDELVNVTIAGYTIKCFREAMERESGGGG